MLKIDNKGLIKMEDIKNSNYSSRIDLENGEWIEFLQAEGNRPSIKWSNNYSLQIYGLEELEKFECNVVDNYNKDSNIYKTYMLEDDKLRSILGLSKRTIGVDIAIKFNTLLKNNKDKLKSYALKEVSANNYSDTGKDYYSPLNVLWCMQAYKKSDSLSSFRYYEETYYHDDEFTYRNDLVGVRYLEQYVCIPVNVLAKILGVDGEVIYNSFTVHADRENQGFI